MKWEDIISQKYQKKMPDFDLKLEEGGILKNSYGSIPLTKSNIFQSQFGNSLLATGFVNSMNIHPKPLFLQKNQNKKYNFDLKWLKMYFLKLFWEHPVDKIKIVPDAVRQHFTGN